MPNENNLAPSIDSISRLIADTRRQRKYSQRHLARRLAGSASRGLLLSSAATPDERGNARMDLTLVLRVLAALNVRITLEVEEWPDDQVAAAETPGDVASD